MILDNKYEKLLSYLLYTIHPYSGNMNFIDGIIGDQNTKKTIMKIMEELEYQYQIIDYDGNKNFINDLYKSLLRDKTTFIFVNSPVFSKELYQTLFNIRNLNRLKLPESKVIDCYLSPMPENTHVFFVIPNKIASQLNYPINGFVDSYLEVYEPS